MIEINLAKPKRLRDKKLFAEIKTMSCVVCGRPPGNPANPIDPSHIKTRGSGGPDAPFNLWPKCRTCHIQWGKSWVRFLEQNPRFRNLLARVGWTFTDEFGCPKLWHPLLEKGAHEI